MLLRLLRVPANKNGSRRGVVPGVLRALEYSEAEYERQVRRWPWQTTADLDGFWQGWESERL